jgi:trimeric autotransporter adhesin
LADNSVTSPKVANNAITGEKIANGAVNGDKIAGGAITGGKIGSGAVGSDQIADGAVTSAKIAGGAVGSTQLAESERSQAFKAEGFGLLNLELAQPVSAAPTVIQSLALPLGGQYVVTGETELILSTGTTQFSQCFLADEGVSIATAADSYDAGALSVSGGVSMTGVSNGGTITLACRSNGEHTFAFNRQIVATRVGSVN